VRFRPIETQPINERSIDGLIPTCWSRFVQDHAKYRRFTDGSEWIVGDYKKGRSGMLP
jgi:hypothetical protein